MESRDRTVDELVQALTGYDPTAAEFDNARLRRVVGLLNLDMAVPDGDLLGCLGTVLGMVARKIEEMRAAPDFAAVHDKRMSELTPEQQDDARELWLRNNYAYFLNSGEHIKFLPNRLDKVRGPVVSDPCADKCQYSVDVGMYPEHTCGGDCQYEKHGKAEPAEQVKCLNQSGCIHKGTNECANGCIPF